MIRGLQQRRSRLRLAILADLARLEATSQRFADANEQERSLPTELHWVAMDQSVEEGRHPKTLDDLRALGERLRSFLERVEDGGSLDATLKGAQEALERARYASEVGPVEPELLRSSRDEIDRALTAARRMIVPLELARS